MTPIDVRMHCWQTVKVVSVAHNGTFVLDHVLLLLLATNFLAIRSILDFVERIC